MGGGIILLFIIISVSAYLIVIYNKFISLRSGIDAALSNIDIQLKRRYDLIPVLVDTIKNYKEYETDIVEKIIKVRQVGLTASSIEEKSSAANMLSSALGKIFAGMETYPDLKTDTTLISLQDELIKLENAIQDARHSYNAIVMEYNTKLESFPDLLIAQKFNFEPHEYFKLEEGEARKVKQMPKINI